MHIVIAIPIPQTGAPHRLLVQCQHALQAAEPNISLADPDQFHIRLAGAEPVTNSQLAAVELVVRDVAASLHPFSVALQWWHALPSRAKPRIVCTCAIDEAFATEITPLALISDRLSVALEDLGLALDAPPDRHRVTLGRVKGTRHSPHLTRLLGEFLTGGAHFIADHLTIYELTGSAAAPRLTPLFDAPLQGMVKEWLCPKTGVWNPPQA